MNRPSSSSQQAPKVTADPEAGGGKGPHTTTTNNFLIPIMPNTADTVSLMQIDGSESPEQIPQGSGLVSHKHTHDSEMASEQNPKGATLVTTDKENVTHILRAHLHSGGSSTCSAKVKHAPRHAPLSAATAYFPPTYVIDADYDSKSSSVMFSSLSFREDDIAAVLQEMQSRRSESLHQQQELTFRLMEIEEHRSQVEHQLHAVEGRVGQLDRHLQGINDEWNQAVDEIANNDEDRYHDYHAEDDDLDLGDGYSDDYSSEAVGAGDLLYSKVVVNGGHSTILRLWRSGLTPRTSSADLSFSGAGGGSCPGHHTLLSPACKTAAVDSLITPLAHQLEDTRTVNIQNLFHLHNPPLLDTTFKMQAAPVNWDEVLSWMRLTTVQP